jgi:hypothetical protein
MTILSDDSFVSDRDGMREAAADLKSLARR